MCLCVNIMVLTEWHQSGSSYKRPNMIWGRRTCLSVRAVQTWCLGLCLFIYWYVYLFIDLFVYLFKFLSVQAIEWSAKKTSRICWEFNPCRPSRYQSFTKDLHRYGKLAFLWMSATVLHYYSLCCGLYPSYVFLVKKTLKAVKNTVFRRMGLPSRGNKVAEGPQFRNSSVFWVTHYRLFSPHHHLSALKKNQDPSFET